MKTSSPQKRSLILRADGDALTGMGHLMRCFALGQAWQESGGEVILITQRIPESVAERYSAEGMQVYRVPEMKDGLSAEELRAYEAHPGSWVALDGYSFDEKTHEALRATGHPLLAIDDNSHLGRYDVDIVLNQNVHAPELHYRTGSKTKVLAGVQYVLLRKEFRRPTVKARRFACSDRRLLFTFGGGDTDRLHAAALTGVQDLERLEIQMPRLGGRPSPELDHALKQSPHDVKLLTNSANMADAMDGADVAVSAAGTTSWELLSLGVPSLFVTIADNQNGIATRLAALGAGEDLGAVASNPWRNLGERIRAVLADPAHRRRMSEAGRKVVDGKGGQRVLAAMSATTTAAAKKEIAG